MWCAESFEDLAQHSFLLLCTFHLNRKAYCKCSNCTVQEWMHHMNSMKCTYS